MYSQIFDESGFCSQDGGTLLSHWLRVGYCSRSLTCCLAAGLPACLTARRLRDHMITDVRTCHHLSVRSFERSLGKLCTNLRPMGLRECAAGRSRRRAPSGKPVNSLRARSITVSARSFGASERAFVSPPAASQSS